LSERDVLDAVERLALRQGDRHSPVALKEVPPALDPPRDYGDAETQSVVVGLLQQRRLVVKGVGTLALTRGGDKSE
jgi:hypothetical protein